MSLAHDPIVTTTSLDGTLHYRLPVGKSSKGALLGALLLVPAGLLLGFTGFVVYKVHDTAPTPIPFLPFIIFFLALGLFILLLSAWSLAGHATVTLGRERIRACSWLGPIPLAAGSRSRGQLRRLVVSSNPSGIETTELLAVFTSSRPLCLAWMYPAELLTALAARLAEHLPDVSVERESLTFTGQRSHQPVRSRIRVERSGETERYTIPASGSRSPALVFFLFGVVWCLAFAFVTWIVAPRALRSGHFGEVLFLLPFWGAGLALILVPLQVMRRRVVFEVVSGGLTVHRVGVFTTRTTMWTSGALAGLHAQQWQSSDDTDCPPALVFSPREGTASWVSGFYGLDRHLASAEYEWLATMLRQRLGLPDASARAENVRP